MSRIRFKFFDASGILNSKVDTYDIISGMNEVRAYWCEGGSMTVDTIEDVASNEDVLNACNKSNATCIITDEEDIDRFLQEVGPFDVDYEGDIRA